MKSFFFLFFTSLIFSSLTAEEERPLSLPPAKPGWTVSSIKPTEWEVDAPSGNPEEFESIRSFYEDTCRNQGGWWDWQPHTKRGFCISFSD